MGSILFLFLVAGGVFFLIAIALLITFLLNNGNHAHDLEFKHVVLDDNLPRAYWVGAGDLDNGIW
jgi:hypothetical protein